MIPYGKIINAYGLMTAIEQFSSATAQQVPLAIESATCESLRNNFLLRHHYVTTFDVINNSMLCPAEIKQC